MPIVQTSADAAETPLATVGAAPPSAMKSLTPKMMFTMAQMKRPKDITLRALLRSVMIPFVKRATPYSMPPAVRNAPS